MGPAALQRGVCRSEERRADERTASLGPVRADALKVRVVRACALPWRFPALLSFSSFLSVDKAEDVDVLCRACPP